MMSQRVRYICSPCEHGPFNGHIAIHATPGAGRQYVNSATQTASSLPRATSLRYGVGSFQFGTRLARILLTGRRSSASRQLSVLDLLAFPATSQLDDIS